MTAAALSNERIAVIEFGRVEDAIRNSFVVNQFAVNLQGRFRDFFYNGIQVQFTVDIQGELYTVGFQRNHVFSADRYPPPAKNCLNSGTHQRSSHHGQFSNEKFRP